MPATLHSLPLCPSTTHLPAQLWSLQYVVELEQAKNGTLTPKSMKVRLGASRLVGDKSPTCHHHQQL